ncbi:PIG-L family deacetylase [Coraliomargarita sp. SDUM461004]|uniref:PIG-L family deacetylase n=1 Tax=Thalassobacterium sedimentorum TaxID=3041258 RepID=A0ABU1AH70_9BACT|nr:PIG-L family deacetylase [Coraliomargarita sp. SDUM461004]MDQ8194172.1 PIG-L family deacetylase [Coraliomargarita sp. SDUM461004]
MSQQAPALKLLAIGAHPDDLEFGMGAVLLKEFAQGTEIAMVVTSKGEAGSAGTPVIREAETRAAAKMLGASERLSFLDFGGDGLQTASPENSVQLARIIREFRPDIICAPSLSTNQHPDHCAVGNAARNACRLARYGGLAALAGLPSHSVSSLWFYSITAHEDNPLSTATLIDVSEMAESWQQLMACHASQVSQRAYIELQLSRAQQLGSMAGCKYAMALWPNDPPVIQTLGQLQRTARAF